MNCLSVGLKYLLINQVVQVQYEGESRRFHIESLSTDLSHPSDLVDTISDDIESLSIGSATLWTTGWDLTVHVVDNGSADQDKQSTHIQVRLLVAYSSVYSMDITLSLRLNLCMTQWPLRHMLLSAAWTTSSHKSEILSKYP